MKKQFVIITLLILSSLSLFAQTVPSTALGQDLNLNAISTGVPFLTIAPDARSGAMGDVGAATSPDANSVHWNPAKYAFLDEKVAFNISYIPWLRKLVSDINFSNISGAYKIDKNQAFGMSMMYFSLGNVVFTNEGGDKIQDFRPYEMSLDLAYALKLHKTLSGGIALRYVHSNLTGGISSGTENSKPGNAIAGDVSVFYTKDMEVSKKESNLSIGLNISNLGQKISYGDSSEPEFLPANLRLGTAFKLNMDAYNAITIAADINKLLVPTPPEIDPLTGKIIAGKDPKVSVPTGVFQSFNDAPGGFSEEMHELMYSFGLEYMYNDMFAVRGGYFHEHNTKGGRKYFTMGIGVKLNVLDIDFAYVLPTAGRTNPLSNTLRFTLGFDFSKKKK